MTAKRTLLLLGGSRQQVPAIEAAKRCGYRTVVCDYLPDNPGQYVCDVSYLISTTDREAVLELARTEQVDGIIAYSSDPASPTAAYVAQCLGLPTNPLKAVETMSEKNKFRDVLHELGLPCPQSVAFDAGTSCAKVAEKVADLSLPIVMKPTDSSGSKGVSVLQSFDGLALALEYARANSRNDVLIAEEYIEKTFPNVIGGDIFVVNGQVRFWGIMGCLRDERCKLVPIGKKLPSGLNSVRFRRVQKVFQRLVEALGVRFGELNVEAIIGKDDLVYVLELGSRAGGNMIPVQLSDASGIDLIEANVRCAMGEQVKGLSWKPDDTCLATHVLHTMHDGIYCGYELSEQGRAALYREVIYQQKGTPVERFDGANKALGILFFRFADVAQMEDFLEHIDVHVKVRVQ